MDLKKYQINKINYVNDYNKKHYKQLKINLKIEEYEKLEEYCRRNNISKAQKIKDIINNL